MSGKVPEDLRADLTSKDRRLAGPHSSNGDIDWGRNENDFPHKPVMLC